MDKERPHQAVKENQRREKLLFSRKILPEYKYFISSRTASKIFDDPLFIDIINSPNFLRLKTISFLGAIDYLLDPNQHFSWNRHNRLQHSLNVARLALTVAEAKGVSPKERSEIIVGALLHDIGHSPLSHTLEKIYIREYGIDHHTVTAGIITGQSRSMNYINGILRSHGVNVEKIVSIVSGESFMGVSFTDNINIDTLEAIPRCWTYINKNHTIAAPEVLAQSLANPLDIDTGWIDNFWRSKDIVYKHFINGGIGRLADQMVDEYFYNTREEFQADDFIVSEIDFKKRHRRLFDRFRFARRQLYGAGDPSAALRIAHDSIEAERVFEVSSEIKIGQVSDLTRRYKQFKRLSRSYNLRLNPTREFDRVMERQLHLPF